MTEIKEEEKRIDYLKFFNTALLSLISIVAVMIFSTVTGVKEYQSVQAAEMVRLKTVQDINVSNVDKLNSRVVALEYDRNTQIQNWVEQNYVRKPQGK